MSSEPGGIAQAPGSRVDGLAGASASARPAYLVICNDSEYFLRHRQAVVDELVRRQAEVTVVTGGKPISPSTARGWSAVHVPIARFSFHPWRDLALVWRAFREIAARKPRAVHLITLKPAVFGGIAAILARATTGAAAKVVITIPGLGRLMSPSNPAEGLAARLSRGLSGRLIRFLSARPDVFFTFETSHDRSLWLQEGWIREENSTVIKGAGVDPRIFRPPDHPSGDGPMRALFASRLLGAKGLDVFVAVARRLAGRGDIEFVVAGIAEPTDPDGVDPDTLEQDDAVTFLGEVAQMPELLRGVDVVCLPTRYGEGIPRILIEAVATGLPCIASDIEGCREIVVDGETGILLGIAGRREMTDALEAAILRYLDDPALRGRHGEAARALFLSKEFSEEQVVRRFVELLGPA